jgi:hypothetical protein
MASVGNIVSELGAVKNQLNAAKTATDAAGQTAEEMATQAEAMELDNTAKGLLSLHVQIEAMGERIAVLGDDIDDLVDDARNLREGSGSGRSERRPPASNGSVGAKSGSGRNASPGKKKKVRPKKNARIDAGSRKAEKAISKAPGWRSRALSVRTASIASVTATGVASVAGTVAHLPLPAQGAVSSLLTILTIWQAHKSNPKDDEKKP